MCSRFSCKWLKKRLRGLVGWTENDEHSRWKNKCNDSFYDYEVDHKTEIIWTFFILWRSKVDYNDYIIVGYNNDETVLKFMFLFVIYPIEIETCKKLGIINT